MEKLRQLLLFFRLVAYVAKAYSIDSIRRKFATPFLSTPTASTPLSEVKNVVVIGASFAGYNAARLLASSLPPGFRLVVVEPRSHFHFTWVFPRFCVVPGHDMKAFIPYGAYLPKHRDGAVTWMRGRAVELTSKTVTIQMVGDGAEKKMEVLPYEFLVVATGSISKNQDDQEDTGGLPSRLVDDDRAAGTRRMERLQKRIANAKRLVVVGGGAAGVELATDAASYHNIKETPERKVVLVHSRDALMHRFGPRLQAAALQGCQELGVDVILGDRVASSVADGVITLRSGRELECDCLIDCTGQRPASSLVMALSPQTITPSGHIRVKPTLQIAGVNLPNIYACGDVADADSQTPNGRSAAVQAGVVADNIIAAAWGRRSTYTFRPHWAEGFIKLTLGLEDSVMHFGDSKTELLLHPKDNDPTLGVDWTWKALGATPFEDSTSGEKTS